MIISLFVAFIIIPWASIRLLKKHSDSSITTKKPGFLDRIYKTFVSYLLDKKLFTFIFFGFCFVLLSFSLCLVYMKFVKVKMLPFDNKNEFQVLIDYPASTSLQKSIILSKALAKEIIQNKNVEKVQIFSGEPAPFSFSGMVKHTYLRHSDYQNDLQIVLVDKNERKISSHQIIENLRSTIKNFGIQNDAITKVLEIPPGPPVLATVVAEVYGPNKKIRNEAAKEVYFAFQNEQSVVDLDYSWRVGRDRKIYAYNQLKGGLLGTKANEISQIGLYTFSESPLLTIDDISSPEDVSLDFSLNQSIRSGVNPFQNQTVSSFESAIAQVDKVLNFPEIRNTEILMRKNLRPVEYITSELSGSEEAPVYGVQKLSNNIHYPLQTVDVPWDTKTAVVKWDGEWFITYEVFRDLGLSFAIVLILIYILVVGWFKSYFVPIVIMAPIPLSLIGIFPGHAIFGAFFTATSMIGFIAGAGILVRNSIILIDFIENEMKEGIPLKEAVIHAGATRFRPMLLTAAAVVVGSSVILFDSIFQGLAISLMFGEISATLFSFFVVPILYFWLVGKQREALFLNHKELKNNK
jgi:multidrug efflux pump subunit AcrB